MRCYAFTLPDTVILILHDWHSFWLFFFRLLHNYEYESERKSSQASSWLKKDALASDIHRWLGNAYEEASADENKIKWWVKITWKKGENRFWRQAMWWKVDRHWILRIASGFCKWVQGGWAQIHRQGRKLETKSYSTYAWSSICLLLLVK